jgi:hypothetical protein
MEQASLNIGTIGQRLEAARQSKGVSVSEAGQATKILSKFIEAMESDDFGALSAPVYAKSFIKMYASYLGLDARPLVDEYVSQHAPKSKAQLSDEVRQNLAKADVPASEPKTNGAPAANGKVKQVFGGVNEAVVSLPGAAFPLKYVLPVVGLVLVGILVLSATQCADDEAEAPAPTGAASVQRQTITQGIPDAYLVEPGVVEVDKN